MKTLSATDTLVPAPVDGVDGKDGADGKDGQNGKDGARGAKMRTRTWAAGTQYLCGADGEEFYDVVLYNDLLYLCVKSHTATAATNPQQSVAAQAGLWELAQQWVFIATELLLARKIKAEEIDTDSLVATQVNARMMSLQVCTNDPLTEEPDGSFTYDTRGPGLLPELEVGETRVIEWAPPLLTRAIVDAELKGATENVKVCPNGVILNATDTLTVTDITGSYFRLIGIHRTDADVTHWLVFRLSLVNM